MSTTTAIINDLAAAAAHGRPGDADDASTPVVPSPPGTCPHCARDLEGPELDTGLCESDDCPRHDAAAEEP